MLDVLPAGAAAGGYAVGYARPVLIFLLLRAGRVVSGGLIGRGEGHPVGACVGVQKPKQKIRPSRTVIKVGYPGMQGVSIPTQRPEKSRARRVLSERVPGGMQ
ncbi:putative hypothetical protein [Deinococcus grandis]|uniref:Uncharacterized protein n=1 Tax=Deinococcus grandis TaxID=57498 RepID=A0A124BR47_9DEIO|nr:hypothetical protein DEGR_00090 [Deinococcus grandis]GAQ20042.1 putative hypothetical protein [Deinococcus grandis]